MTEPVTKAMLLKKLEEVSEFDGWYVAKADDERAIHDSDETLADEHTYANDNDKVLPTLAIENAGKPLTLEKDENLDQVIDDENQSDELRFVLPEPYDAEQLARFEETLAALEVPAELSTDEPVTLKIDPNSLINLHQDIHNNHIGYLAKLSSISEIKDLKLLGLENIDHEPSLCIEIPLDWNDPELSNLETILRTSGVDFTFQYAVDNKIVLTIEGEAIDYLLTMGVVQNESDDLLLALNSFSPVAWEENYWEEEKRWGFSPLDHVDMAQSAKLEALFSTLGINLQRISNDGDNMLWLERDDAQRVYDEVQRVNRTIKYDGKINEKSTRGVTN